MQHASGWVRDYVRGVARRYIAQAYPRGQFGDPEARSVGYMTSKTGWQDRTVLSNVCAWFFDDTPINYGWLAAVGFNSYGIGLWVHPASPSDCRVAWKDGEVRISGGCTGITTRGGLRLVCVGLGIILNEPVPFATPDNNEDEGA